MEHWLPLYYETLETLFDSLPKAPISLDYQAEEASTHRLDSIADFYAARQSLAAQPRSTAPLYRPVRPEQMFLDDAEWKKRLRAGAVVRLSPFGAPEEGGADSFDAGARPAKNFATERANPNANLFDAVREYLDAERKAGRHAAIAAYSEGSADRLANVLREHGLADLRRIAGGAALARLPPSAGGRGRAPPGQGLPTHSPSLLGGPDTLRHRAAPGAPP